MTNIMQKIGLALVAIMFSFALSNTAQAQDKWGDFPDPGAYQPPKAAPAPAATPKPTGTTKKNPPVRRGGKSKGKKPEAPQASTLCPDVEGESEEERSKACKKQLFEEFMEFNEEKNAEVISEKVWNNTFWIMLACLAFMVGFSVFNLKRTRRAEEAAEKAISSAESAARGFNELKQKAEAHRASQQGGRNAA